MGSFKRSSKFLQQPIFNLYQVRIPLPVSRLRHAREDRYVAAAVFKQGRPLHGSKASPSVGAAINGQCQFAIEDRVTGIYPAMTLLLMLQREHEMLCYLKGKRNAPRCSS